MKKKLLLILLACLLLVSTCLAGCNKEPTNETPTDTESVTLPPTDDPDLPDNEILEIPDELDYGKADFTILTYNANVKEFGDETATDVISQTQVERDSMVEEALGVTIYVESMNGQWADRLTYSDTVRQNVMTGNKNWDLIGAYSYVAPNLSLNNVTVDMRTTDYLDFSKAWWPQYMVDITTVNNKTFFISGDVSVNSLFEMIPIFFNAEVLEAHGFVEEELYDMVREGNWTYENFFGMIENASVLSGDTVWNDDDLYAFTVLDNTCFDAFYYTELAAFREGEDGKLTVAEDDFLGEQALDIFETVYDAANTYHSLYFNSAIPRLETKQTIFATYKLYNMRLTQNPNQFGILPWPKYEEGTNSWYQTLLGSPHTQYCIPTDIDDYNRSAAVLEMLAYTSYKYLTPVVFEDTMQLRYSRDENASEMFDIIRDGLTTDLGILYYDAFAVNFSTRDVQSIFRNMILGGKDNWISNYNNNYSAGLTKVKNLLNELYQ